MQAAEQADVALVWKPPGALFDEQRNLRLIFNLGAGVDALLALPNLPRQVPLVRLEDAGMSEALAEYVLAAVLRVYRGFDRYAAQQRAGRWQPVPLRDRSGFNVGVLGLGVIGGVIAQTLARHGFAVRGFARGARQIDGVQCEAGPLDPAAPACARFLDGLDVLVGVLPLTASTRGALNAALFARLARGAHLVNVGRGAHLNEADLLAALDSGQLGGATLDVFTEEPLPAAHRFWSRPEILVTPHVSAETQIGPSVRQIAAKLAAWQRGHPVSGVVDPLRGY
jgi:glyoxylate/hydroxypyruvate reductase A